MDKKYCITYGYLYCNLRLNNLISLFFILITNLLLWAQVYNLSTCSEDDVTLDCFMGVDGRMLFCSIKISSIDENVQSCCSITCMLSLATCSIDVSDSVVLSFKDEELFELLVVTLLSELLFWERSVDDDDVDRLLQICYIRIIIFNKYTFSIKIVNYYYYHDLERALKWT